MTRSETRWHALALFSLLLASTEVAAQGLMLRVGCEGSDIGAEVLIDGRFNGECPLGIQISEGNLRLRLVKKVNALHERVFEQDIRMGEGAIKRVEARLGPARLTAEGARIEAQRQETARLRDLAAAEQQRQEVVARGLVELKAQGLEPES